MKPGLYLTIVSLILAAFLSGCLEQREESEGAPVDGTIKIGVLQSLTGDLGSYGGPMSDAMKLAAKEINANGGLQSRLFSWWRTTRPIMWLLSMP